MSPLSTETVTFDLSEGNEWGRAVYAAHGGPEPGKPLEVNGCLTPLPEVGNTLLVKGGELWKFTRVKYWHNPRDAFEGTLERING